MAASNAHGDAVAEHGAMRLMIHQKIKENCDLTLYSLIKKQCGWMIDQLIKTKHALPTAPIHL
jgi:citrate lyase gamma subunit